MSKILLLVEGEKLDVELLERFYDLYNKSNVELVSYKTNIYRFHKRLKKDFSNEFGEIDYDSIDLPLFLNDYLRPPEEKRLNDSDFIEKILVFDFDPQDPLYSSETLSELIGNFSNSTENGKLYLNYPMVESFRDMKSLDDDEFINSTVDLEILKQKKYKDEVNKKSCIKQIKDIDVEIGSKLMDLHNQKVDMITSIDSEDKYLNLCKIQCEKLEVENLTWIVNTSTLHLLDEYGSLK